MRAPTTRAELQAASPTRAVRSLADLPETERVWTGSVQFGELAHRKSGHLTAACGAAILEWAVSAGHLAVLGGRLCPACWPTTNPAGAASHNERE